MEYNDIELRQLKVVHVEVPSVPNFMNISMVDQAICDTGLMLLADMLSTFSPSVISGGFGGAATQRTNSGYDQLFHGS
jgi:hypothetical protein